MLTLVLHIHPHTVFCPKKLAVAHAFAHKGYVVALLTQTPSKLLDLKSQITQKEEWLHPFLQT